MNFNNEDLSKAFESSLKSVNHTVLDAQVLMYRFLSEVEKITEEKNISRKSLAKLVGTSPSYITQLFQGNKIISLELLGRIQRALDIKFEINAVHANNRNCEKTRHAFFFERTTHKNLIKHRYTSIRNLYDITPSEKYDISIKHNRHKEPISA